MRIFCLIWLICRGSFRLVRIIILTGEYFGLPEIDQNLTRYPFCFRNITFLFQPNHNYQITLVDHFISLYIIYILSLSSYIRLRRNEREKQMKFPRNTVICSNYFYLECGSGITTNVLGCINKRFPVLSSAGIAVTCHENEAIPELKRIESKLGSTEKDRG